jgi:flagellar biosynthesis protein FlhB
MILLLYGFDVTSAVDVPDVPQSSDLSNLDGTPKTDRPTPEPKPPCNTSASTLSNLMFIFIIPFLASLYCLAQLVYRGLSGMVALMDTTDADMQHANKMNMVLGYLVFFIILYTLWPVFLYITIPTIIKSFATKEYLDLYYSKLKLLGL